MLEIAGGNKCNYEMQPCKTWSGAGCTPCEGAERAGNNPARTSIRTSVGTRAHPRCLGVPTPHARLNSARAARFAPAEKRCAAQAEYGRLAAQA